MTNYFSISFLFLFITFSSACFAQSTKARGQLVWYDEFNGTGIPDPKKWDRPEYNRRANDNGPDGWWSKDDSYLNGKGDLVIRVKKFPNKNADADAFDYSCGAIRTKGLFEQLHGIYEIRCKLPTQQGWWVAFWMMQGNVGSVANGGVDGSEVDIMEAFGWTDKINQAVHWDGYGTEHKSTGHQEVIAGIRNGYHTYAMEWHPDEYLFFIDGVETWRTKAGGVCNQPGYLKITGEISTSESLANQYWANNPANAVYPDSFLVDYVRVYKFADDVIENPIRNLVESCYPDGNFVFGSACHEFNLGTQTEEILDREFSYITPANDFKQSYIHPEPGVWNWERSDKWVKHCRENNQVIRMHAPISPQCSEWAKTDTRTPAELEQNLTEYMTELCKRYSDTTHIKWLDVVNETVSTDGTWFGPKEGTEKWENPWPIIGYDDSHPLNPPIYIKKAFEIATKNRGHLQLIINQHGGMEDAMWDKIKALVSYLRENNLRVDGIGWQAHIWLGWEKEVGNMEKLEKLIDWCHSNQLEFHITEFNVWLKPEDLNKTEEQANTFYEITKLAAEKSKNGFVGVNIWHIRGVETQNKDRDGGPWAENYEPKESAFRIKDAICQASGICSGNCGVDKLSLMVDSFRVSANKNLLGGAWTGESDANSLHFMALNQPGGYQNSISAKLGWELKKGAVAYPYAVFQTFLNENKSPVDLKKYSAIKFQGMGTGIVNVGLVTSKSIVDGNHFLKEINLKSEWTAFEIPFNELRPISGTATGIDTGKVIAIIFSAAGNFNEPGEIWLDNLQFNSENLLSPVVPPEKPVARIFYEPKINQLGYLPGASKIFSIVSDSAKTGQDFKIIDHKNAEVFTGKLSLQIINDTEISGEKVLTGDFSNFSTPGNYKIKVGEKTSFPFAISDTVFDAMLFNSVRFFYLARANVAKNDVVSGLVHGEAHAGELLMQTGNGNFRDVTGGWYNAGDFGKWVHTAAITCENLLNLFEINPNYFRKTNFLIPESNNKTPDLLDEVKVGLNWLLKMQNPDGSVFHKVDSEPDFAYGYGPDEDPHSRKIADPNKFSTIDAADFTAVMAHAARVFQKYDSAFSANCKNAALLSWQWVQKNPGIGQTDLYYADPLSWQEEFWAKAEIYLLTKNSALLGSLYSDIVSKSVVHPSWTAPHLYAYSKLYNDASVPVSVKNWIRLKVENYATELKKVVENSGYGCAIDKFGWTLGSNTAIADMGFAFISAYLITGEKSWLNLANKQLDYLMGRNSLNYSFVTGAGTNACQQPFHWITKTYGIVPNGVMGQGAAGASLLKNATVDKYVKPLMEAGWPSAKIYIDSVDSWISNEVDIFTVSSLAGLTGFIALHDREVQITGIPLFNYQENVLEVEKRKSSLLCKNCEGKTRIELFSADGQLLHSQYNQHFENRFLINCNELIQNGSLVFYRVQDESGRIATGKIQVFGE